MDYLMTFIEGIASFISPCVLPMLPIYISYFAGKDEDKKKGASGIPGFAGSLILLKELRKAGCSEKRLDELCGKAVNRIFKLDLPYKVPSNTEIDASLPGLRSGYPFDAFEFFV